jgi:histone H1/5
MSTTAAAPAKKPAAPKKDPGHPTYAVMVKEAIASLKERSGSSLPAITKVPSHI